MSRVITYREAVSEAFVQAFARDPDIFMMGCGVTDPKGTFGTTLEVARQFGKERVFDVPLSENALTGIAVGAAFLGLHPLLVHQRSDFLLLTMDQIVNHAAKWKYMTGGRLSVPVTIRSIVGQGWGQAAQHSQNLHSLFAHIPGLKVVLPSDAYDAKGLMLTSLATKAPVLFIEHRWLHETSCDVPEKPYQIPFGQASIKQEGRDLTIASVSYMTVEALKAAVELEKDGIQAEVCDLRTVSPVDWQTLFASVRKTKRLLIADTGWKSFGVSAEIAARVYENESSSLAAVIERVALPDIPTPCSSSLEKIYYPDSFTIIQRARSILSNGKTGKVSSQERIPIPSAPTRFVGPF